MLVILAAKGSSKSAFGIHGATAVVMVLTAMPSMVGGRLRRPDSKRRQRQTSWSDHPKLVSLLLAPATYSYSAVFTRVRSIYSTGF